MALVKEIDFGKGKPHVSIYDDCVYKTQEEIDQMNRNLARIIVEGELYKIKHGLVELPPMESEE